MSHEGLIYLDASASAPLDPRVIQAIVTCAESAPANPSSLHPAGQAARLLIERARAQVAALLGCRPIEVAFTSGGTEANALALEGALRAASPERRRIVTSAVEHPSVLESCKAIAERDGFDLVIVGVDSCGRIDEAAALAALDATTAVASLQAGNNEVGTRQLLGRIADRARAVGATLHVDAVQLPGHASCQLRELGADLVSISAHKFHGPAGVGALIISKQARFVAPRRGGAQEGGRRPGTENLLGIVGMGVAAEIAAAQSDDDRARIRALRDRFETAILDAQPTAIVNAAAAERLPHISSIAFGGGVDGVTLQIALGAAGLAVSTGSACTAGSTKASHVLLAMGLGERLARSTLRFSLCRMTSAEEIKAAAARVNATIMRMRRLI